MRYFWLLLQEQYSTGHQDADYVVGPSSLLKQILGVVVVLAIIIAVIWKARQDRE